MLVLKPPYQLEFEQNGACALAGVRTPVDYQLILASGQKVNQTEKFGFGQLVNATGGPVYEVIMSILHRSTIVSKDSTNSQDTVHKSDCNTA